MSVSTKLQLAFFAFAICACNSNKNQELDGTWKIVRATSEFVSESDIFYDGINEVTLEEWEPRYWTFYGDSIMQSDYPNFAHYFRKYKIVSEDEILNSHYDDEVFSKKFSGDTLILKRHSPKYYQTFYFLKQDVDERQIELLKTVKVDWSKYHQKWKFDKFTESGGMKCSRNFPAVLDLTEANSNAYEIIGNRLKYWENDTLHQFVFSTAYGDELDFKHACDSGCQYQWVGYKKYD